MSPNYGPPGNSLNCFLRAAFTSKDRSLITEPLPAPAAASEASRPEQRQRGRQWQRKARPALTSPRGCRTYLWTRQPRNSRRKGSQSSPCIVEDGSEARKT